MKTFSQFIEEARQYKLPDTTALLPVTKTLWDKNKVSVADINKMWPEGKHTIQVAHHQGDPAKLRYIFGSGHTEHKDNYVIRAHHDQTMAKLGSFKVQNTIHVTDGKIVKSVNAVDNVTRAPVLVYK